MNKTPVSTLQEMMVKRGIVPNYELICGGATHINTFVFRVVCDNLEAEGTGRCKKDAKHEAANAMLKKIAARQGYLQLQASPAKSPIRTPLPPVIPAQPRALVDQQFVNDVGALQDFCTKSNLESPKYINISDAGPAHAKVFTVECRVSTFKEQGVATTKKQAKHEAARKMLEKLQELVGDDLNEHCIHPDDIPECLAVQRAIINEEAKVRYPALTKYPGPKKVNLGLKISEYHNILKNSIETPHRYSIISKLLELCDIVSDYAEDTVEEYITQFEEILKIMELQLTCCSLKMEYSDCAISASVDSSPDIIEIGMGNSSFEAKYRAVNKLKKTLISLL